MAHAALIGTAIACKSFINLTSNLRTNNLDVLLSLLPSASKPNGPGLLTYSNHISVLDEPLWCGALPWQHFLHYDAFRWTLGAKDICFTNPIFSAYFRAGKVLETDRKAGIYQPSVDHAIAALNAGQWVHLFPEGYVNQPKAPHGNQTSPHQLLRFRWGISRMIIESSNKVNILPMNIQGFDKVMPEGRSKPWKFMPRIGETVGIAFPDQPLDRRRLIDPLLCDSEQWTRGTTLEAPYTDESPDLKTARMSIAEVLRSELDHLQLADGKGR